jgi:hypothetical protein
MRQGRYLVRGVAGLLGTHLFFSWVVKLNEEWDLPAWISQNGPAFLGF